MTQTGTVEVSTAAGVDKPIDEEMPCFTCGYNLRGLLPNGRCPECAFDVKRSLFEHADRVRTIGRPLSAGGREWLLHLIEGAALVQVVLLLMLLIAQAPDWAWTRRSRAREVLLGIGCTIWVLAWMGVWKVGRPERGTPTKRSLWLRASSTLYLAVPFARPLFPHFGSPNGALIALVLSLMGAGAVASVLYYRVIALLGERAGSRWFHLHAMTLIFLGGIYLLAGLLLPRGHGSPDSLSMILAFPTIQLGSADHVRTMIQFWGWHPLEMLAAIFPIWATMVNLWLLFLLGSV